MRVLNACLPNHSLERIKSRAGRDIGILPWSELIALFALLFHPRLEAQAAQAEITVLDRSGSPVWDTVDGDSLRLLVRRKTKTNNPQKVYFEFENGSQNIAQCLVPKDEADCVSPRVDSLGWYGDVERKPNSLPHLIARTEESAVIGSVIIRVMP